MSSQFIKIILPLTNHKGRIRVKKRKNILEQGTALATRQEKIENNCYFEWQISYDLKKSEFAGLEKDQKPFNEIEIKDQSGNLTERYIYELSDLLLEILKKRFIDFQYLKKLLGEIQAEKRFIKDELRVIRNLPKDKNYKFGKYSFLKGTIEHPLLIYEISELVLKIEIIIRERQRAVGIQPMLFLCIPLKLAEEFAEIKGQPAKTKQIVTYLITKNNFRFIIETIRIFALLSKKHHQDVVNILTTILDWKESIN